MAFTEPTRTATPRRDSLWIGVVLALLVGAAVYLVGNRAFDVDDAPITYRYANNLAGGLGFVYNAGERVQGTSTPLYTFLLAGLDVAGLEPPQGSALLNLLGTMMTMALVYATGWRAGGGRWLPAAFGVSLTILFHDWFVFASLGMETPVYIAVTLGALHALAYGGRRAEPWAAFWAALAVLCRLDGFAVALAVFVTLTWQQRRLPWRALLLFAALVMPWFLFAWGYFGSPLPNSMAAKQQHVAWSGVSRYWIWQQLFTRRSLTFPALLILAPLGVAAGTRSPVGRRWILAPLLWLAVYLAAYTLVGIDFYPWYLAPVYPILALLAGLGLGAIWPLLRVSVPGRPFLERALHGALGLVLLALLLVPYAGRLLEQIRATSTYTDLVEGSRVAAGRWLRTHAAPGSKVYSGFVGHIGYESGLYVIDGANLVSRGGNLRQAEADYFVLSANSPDRPECGPVADFSAGVLDPTFGRVIVSRCGGEPLARFGPLRLDSARLTTWAQAEDGTFGIRDRYLVETQWRLEDDLPASLLNGQADVFVHFLDEAGATLAQADHPLGRSLTGVLLPLTTWPAGERIYSYAELPPGYEAIAPRVRSVRMGVWIPETSETFGAPITFSP